MYKIKCQRTSKCLWPVEIDMLVVKWMVFFDVFINHFQKIQSVLHKIAIDLSNFWDVYDVNLWEKLAIMVKLCFIETRLKKGYDLQGYSLKMTRETKNVLTIVVIHYFSEWTSFRSSHSEVICKKSVLRISQNLQQKTCACSLQLYLKRSLLQVFEFHEILTTTFLIDHLWWLLLVFSFKLILPSFYIKKDRFVRILLN